MKTLLPTLSFLLIGLPLVSQAEGSRELTPNLTSYDLTDSRNDRAGFLTHDAVVDNASLGFLKPATWTGDNNTIPFSEDYRLYVRVLPGETLNYGVHRLIRTGSNVAQSDLILSLRYGTGTGTLVQQTTLARNTASLNQSELLAGPGVITSAAQVQAGPLPATGGYAPLQYTNTTGAPQDFYVEFTQVGESTMSDDARRSEYDFWDFTVRTPGGSEKKGRLFSKHWAFSTGQSDGTNSYQNRLSAAFNLYPMVESRTAPGKYYVKQVELAGMRPFLFYFVCNEFGSTYDASSRATIAERRKSQTTRTSYAQYPTFVNDPDGTVWPSAVTPTVSVTPAPYCRNGNTEVAFTTQSAETGQFDILIDLNGNNVQDGNEPLLQQTVQAGSSNTLVWDGKLTDGSRVTPSGQIIKFNFTSNGAPVNFPVFDAEGNPDGFRVRNVRPANGNTYDLLYWDDTNLPTNQFPAPQTSLTGQRPGPTTDDGVHRWGAVNEDGNTYTVNTWTYGFSQFEGNQSFSYTSVCDSDNDGIADATDLDDDNDGILDAVEAYTPTGAGAVSIDPSSFASATSPVLYLDGAYVHPVLGGFRDLNNDGVNDIFDTDLDGIPNHLDLDADGDGLPDAFEANGNSNPTMTFSDENGHSSAYNPAFAKFMQSATSTSAGSVGTNGIPDAVKSSVSYSTTGDVLSQSADSKYLLKDFDNDSRTMGALKVVSYNFLDIDSDNDGITDEIEAQPTAAYLARVNNTALFNRDSNLNGLRDSYDPGNGGTAITSVVDTDGDLASDMFDTDSDNDNANKSTLAIFMQTADWTEGFDENSNGVAGDDIVARARAFSVNNPTKTDYYVVGSNASYSPFLRDDNTNGTPNFLEVGNAYYHDDNFNGLSDIYDPAYQGTPSLAPMASGMTEAAFRMTGVNTPLPVELSAFAARATGLDGLLTWETTQAARNQNFVVERSSDARTFAAMGAVNGAGSTTQAQHYSFLDKDAGATAGTRYYRLRQQDLDGSATYSAVRPIEFSGRASEGNLLLYPNPTAGTTTLNLLALPANNYTVDIIGADGRVLAHRTVIGGAILPFDTQTLANGTYLVRLSGHGLNQLTKLVKH